MDGEGQSWDQVQSPPSGSVRPTSEHSASRRVDSEVKAGIQQDLAEQHVSGETLNWKIYPTAPSRSKQVGVRPGEEKGRGSHLARKEMGQVKHFNMACPKGAFCSSAFLRPERLFPQTGVDFEAWFKSGLPQPFHLKAAQSSSLIISSVIIRDLGKG